MAHSPDQTGQNHTAPDQTAYEQARQDQPPIDVIEPDPGTNPRPEEQAADAVRSEDPATPQP